MCEFEQAIDSYNLICMNTKLLFQTGTSTVMSLTLYQPMTAYVVMVTLAKAKKNVNGKFNTRRYFVMLSAPSLVAVSHVMQVQNGLAFMQS